MKDTTSNFSRAVFALLAAFSLSTITVNAQDCSSLPAFPTSSITTTQDHDQMMCQLGLRYPTLPARLLDPNKPPNVLLVPPPDNPGTCNTSTGDPGCNFTDGEGHTIVRNRWGIWVTYDDGTPLGSTNPGGPDPGYTPIDLLKMKDGAAVGTPTDWWTKRRPEILKDVQEQIYGVIPDKSLWPNITWSLGAITTGTDATSGVAYRERTITGNIDISSYPQLRNVPRISCTLRTPASQVGQKIPVIIGIAGSTSSLFQYAAPYGYGVCAYSPTALQPDSGGANMSSYIIGLINKGNWRKPSDWGALAAWSWGISRLIDFFATYPDVDETRIGVEGHSRYGKATLVAMAYEPRLVAGFPSCGGALGTAMNRRHWGETVESVGGTSEYHWVSGNFLKYMGPLDNSVDPATGYPLHYLLRKMELMPVDAHSVLSLVAPRAVLINGGTDTPPGLGDAWQAPRSMYLTGVNATPVYNLLGFNGLIIPPGTHFTAGLPGEDLTGGTPFFDMAFIDGTIGYRRHKEGHMDTPDWPTFVQLASRYFNDKPPVVTPGQSFIAGYGSSSIGTVMATDADGDALGNWQVVGGSGAYKFQLNRSTGEVTLPDRSQIDPNQQTYTLTVTVSDGKLMSKPQDVTILISSDTTPPTTTAASTPTPNGNGWNNGNAIVSFQAQDNAGGSGVKQITITLSGAQTGTTVVSGDSTEVTISVEGITNVGYYATDNAGNVESAKTLQVKIDKTAPTITINAPGDSAVYLLNAAVASNYSCVDNPSGVASCTGSTASGTNVDTSTVGSHQFTVNATDRAGNNSTKTIPYSVQYAFGGFINLLPMPAQNTAQAGSSVVVRYQLRDANSAYVSDLASFVSLLSYPAACLTGVPFGEAEQLSAPGNTTLRYDALTNQFIFNWKTTNSWTNSCRLLELTLADGTKHDALMQFR